MSRDGGPAFPAQPIVVEPPSMATVLNQPGMTLRDYFAGQALAGIMARGVATGETLTVAPLAYLYSDAMIKERAK